MNGGGSPGPGEEDAEGAWLEVEPRAQGRVYRLAVRRPGKLNVLGAALVGELERAIARVAADSEARVLVLTGGGERAFIGGADIRELAKLDATTARGFISGIHRVCQGLRELPIPVIARIRGYCLGAGLEVAASCDLRFATADSRFGMPEVQVGIPSVVEAALLPRLIGLGRTSDLLLTGRVVDADEALAMGLVHRVATAGEIESTVDEAIALLLEAGPRALALQKALLYQWQELPLGQAIAAGVDAFVRAFDTDEPRRYLRSFLDRRRASSG